MDNQSPESLLYNLKVLYVEDEDFTREELSRFLKRRVGRLYIAKNGLEGFEIFKAHRPDIVIADLKMPVMNGIEMTRKIRELDKDAGIIIISALSDSDTILQAVDIGIVKYIIKPVNTKELLCAMESLGIELLKNKLNQSVINNIVITKEKKNELEKSIKSKFAYFLKNYTGKGPRNIQVFIKGNQIEIKADGVLTVFEKSLISNIKNNNLVNYNRKLLYSDYKNTLENDFKKIIESKVSLREIDIDGINDVDKITFSFS